MKRNINNILVIAGFVLLTACEDFIDRKPLDQITTANFYSSEENAIAAVNASYQPLYPLYQESRYWVLDFMGEDVAKGMTPGDRGDVVMASRFETEPTLILFEDIWKYCYRGIYYSNQAISKISSPEISIEETLKNRLLGEATFLRGLYHFYLSYLFGDVPLYTEVPDPGNLNVPRTPKNEVFAQIIKDFEFAGENLNAIPNQNELGRATKGSAFGMLAMTHLFLGNWQACLEACQAVDNIGYHYLLPEFADLYNYVRNENSPESLFEVQFKFDANSAYGGSGGMMSEFIAPREQGRFAQFGWGFANPYQEFIDLFDNEDVRKKVTILSHGDSIQLPNGRYWAYDTIRHNIGLEHNPTNTYVKKMFDIDYVEGVTGLMMNSSLNQYILRYADVVLMHAEALNELGRSSEALVQLNKIRERGYKSSAFNLSGLGQDELRDAIYKERRKELVMEQKRWFDIVRLGPDKAEALLHGQGRTLFNKNVHMVFPIPQSEMDRNPNLVQNPGYN